MSPLPRGAWIRLLKTAPAAAALVAATTAATSIQPAIPHDFPDPSVLAVGSNYYAYSTASRYGNQVVHVPVARSTSLSGAWTQLGDALPELPPWVAKTGAASTVWAPEVAARSDGSYLLYFTARSAAQNVQCIGVAVASSPAGPFRSTAAQPIVCHPEDVDSIDPAAFTDSDGKQYLLYSSGRGNATIWLQRMSTDGLTPIGARRALLQADRPDEAHIIEAPSLVKHGDKYVLFYSGNAFNSGSYFVNYATASTLAGPFVKHPGQFLNRATLGDRYANPGGQDVVPGRKNDYLVFHAYSTSSARSLFVVGLGWDARNDPELDLNKVSKATAFSAE